MHGCCFPVVLLIGYETWSQCWFQFYRVILFLTLWTTMETAASFRMLCNSVSWFPYRRGKYCVNSLSHSHELSWKMNAQGHRQFRVAYSLLLPVDKPTSCSAIPLGSLCGTLCAAGVCIFDLGYRKCSQPQPLLQKDFCQHFSSAQINPEALLKLDEPWESPSAAVCWYCRFDEVPDMVRTTVRMLFAHLNES